MRHTWLAGLILGLMPAMASAHHYYDRGIGLSVSVGGVGYYANFGGSYCYAPTYVPSYYYAPAPVYVAPPAVVYSAPVYSAPVYAPPVYSAQVYVAPPAYYRSYPYRARIVPGVGFYYRDHHRYYRR